MARRYHRAPEFRRERAYVLFVLPACTLVTCVSLVLANVYRVPGLARACTVHLCVTREGFRLRVNLQKTRVHGYAHAIRAILNAGTVLASIKFKSSCTVNYRAGGSNFTLVRPNATDKKPVDSICMSWNIHPMQEISVMPESWLKSLPVCNTELLQLF